MRYFNKIALIYDKEEQDAREKADLRRRQTNAASASTLANTLGLLGVGGYALRQNAISKSIGNLKKNLADLGEAPLTTTPEAVDLYIAKLLSNNATGTNIIGADYAKRSIPNKVLSYFGFGPEGDIANVPGILGEKGSPMESLKAVTGLLDPRSGDSHESNLGDLGKAESFFKNKAVTPRNIALALGGMGLLTGGAWAYNKYKQNQQEKEIQNIRNKERQYSIDHPIRYNLKRLGF